MKNSVAIHAAFAAHLMLTDRFESGAGIATTGTRARLTVLADDLASRISEMYVPTTVEWVGDDLVVTRHPQHPLLSTLAAQYVRLETELGKLAADQPLSESFHVRRAPWAPSEERLDGDDYDIDATASDAEAEAIRLRFKLQAARKTTIERIELAKAGLVPPFSWKDAWADTKAIMRALGAEIRTEEGCARSYRREQVCRAREVERLDRPIGTTTTDGWALPTEDDMARQARIDEGRDWGETLPCNAVIRDGVAGHTGLTDAELARLNEADALDVQERCYIADDLLSAVLG